ncbi:hypothetical protein [Megalodesulfovibrio paquesii]
MNESPERPLLIAFPTLHPSLLSGQGQGLPAQTRFLDPGLAPPPLRARMVMPPTMPMNRQMARACLAEMLAFGERFKKPGDMAYFSVAGMENFYDGTTMDIREELNALQALGDNAPPPAEDLTEKRLAAQRLLLLAWHLQEKQAEVREAAETLRGLNLRLQSAVVDEEMAAAEEPTLDDPELARLVGELTPRDLDLEPIPAAQEEQGWRKLAEAVLLLLPEGAELQMCTPEIAAALALSGQDATDVPGWRLVGLAAADPARPWLDRVVRCHAPQIGQTGQDGPDAQGAKA